MRVISLQYDRATFLTRGVVRLQLYYFTEFFKFRLCRRLTICPSLHAGQEDHFMAAERKEGERGFVIVIHARIVHEETGDIMVSH